MAARFGPQDSPNACLMCHKDRDAGWLRQKLETWKQGSGGGGRGLAP
jgi:hypothetical protein